MKKNNEEKIAKINEELLQAENDTLKMMLKIYKDAFNSAVKEIERAEQRAMQLTNQLAENRQQFLNLLGLLRTKYGLTSAELGEDLTYGFFGGKATAKYAQPRSSREAFLEQERKRGKDIEDLLLEKDL